MTVAKVLASPFVIRYLVLIVMVLTASANAASDNWKINEIQLTIVNNSINATLLLDQPIVEIIPCAQQQVLLSPRKAWIASQGKLTALKELVPNVSPAFDWYKTAFCYGQNVFLSVSNYSEQQRQKDNSQPSGGFRRGPEDVGILLVNLKTKSSILYQDLPVKYSSRLSNDPDFKHYPKRMNPSPQSVAVYKDEIYIGCYGSLHRLLLDGPSLLCIEYDYGLSFNRQALLKRPLDLWVAYDEGGIGGTWIERKSQGKSFKYFPLNYNMTIPDSIVSFRNQIFISSLAGLIRIDEKTKTYHHYQTTSNKKKMDIYELIVLDQKLYAQTRDGFITYDLSSNTATVHRLSDKQLSNNIFCIGRLDGQLVVANESGLYLVHK